jgi:hypothetical protein
MVQPYELIGLTKMTKLQTTFFNGTSTSIHPKLLTSQKFNDLIKGSLTKGI